MEEEEGISLEGNNNKEVFALINPPKLSKSIKLPSPLTRSPHPGTSKIMITKTTPSTKLIPQKTQAQLAKEQNEYLRGNFYNEPEGMLKSQMRNGKVKEMSQGQYQKKMKLIMMCTLINNLCELKTLYFFKLFIISNY